MFKIITAFDENYGIGYKNSIPWKDPEDMFHFKNITIGDVVIMGRKTAESIPNFPLPDRINIVVSSTWKSAEPSLYKALQKAFKLNCGNIWIIGGASIYFEALTKFKHLCSKIYYTVIPGRYECDTYFPQGGNLPHLPLDTGKKFNIVSLNSSPPEQPYLDLLELILNVKSVRGDRTGTGTLSIFGPQLSFSMHGVLPVITTKRVWLKGVIEELLFFISGKTDTKILENKSVKFWRGNTSEEFLHKRNLPWREGDMGPGYSHQWRHWGAEYKGCDVEYTGQGKDQLMNVIKGIKEDPFDRRHIISAWNPSDLDQMALPPCHCFVQFYVSDCNKYLDCMLYQRSADMFLGVPFNITSYCLLTYIIGHLTQKQPRTFYHNFGDAHIYTNHIEQVKEQLSKAPYHFPSLHIIGDPQNLEDFKYESFKVVDYEHHSTIKADMAI
jgi:thymidylate synthase